MSPEKFVAFLEKLLEKTKRGEIKWRRYEPNPQFEAWASSKKSFTCIAGTMKVDMLSNEDTDTIEIDIKYDKTLPATCLDPKTDEEVQIALRLLNYVYDMFPNLEKSIDEFLNDN